MARPKKGEQPVGFYAASAVLNGECETVVVAAKQFQCAKETVYIWLRKLKEERGLVQSEPSGLQAANAFLAGKFATVGEAAAAFDCTAEGAYKWLRKLGKPARPNRYKVPWPEIDALLGKVRDAEIARKFNVGKPSLHRRRARLGIAPFFSQRTHDDVGEVIPALISAPGALDVKAARERAGLNQREAAELVGAVTGRGWLRYESGERQIGDDRWTLFLLLTGQHPDFEVTRKRQSSTHSPNLLAT